MAKVKTAEPVLYKTAVPPVVKNTAPVKGFNQVSQKRAGRTKYECYPDESTSNPAYKGGTK